MPHVTHRRKKMPFVGRRKQNRLILVLLKVYQSALTQKMDHNPTYKYQVSI